MDFVTIPAGSFLMGSPEREKGRYKDEGPQHKVHVKAFMLQETPVTRRQYKEVMGEDASYFKHDWDCPVEQVSWNDSKRFIEALNKRDGTTAYRLPTEAEWEYAARAGSKSKWSFGGYKRIMGYYAWHMANSEIKTHKVKQKLPNKFGLYDMHGLVWEWVEDIYHDNYNGAPSDGSAWITIGNQSLRVLRGGSWSSSPAFLRSAIRYGYAPGSRNYNIGFRLARTIYE